MQKIIIGIITVVLMSFFYFPFEFVFLPGVNTKMALAGVGLVIFMMNFSNKRDALLDIDFMWISILALLISLVSLVSTTLNETTDGSFTTYFISMWVWLGGAYAVIQWILLSHKRISVKLVSDYLIIVCVCQCIISLLMLYIPSLKNFVDSFLGGDDAYMGIAESRVYGIGCALDVAGLRFCAVLMMIANMSFLEKNNTNQLLLYIASFIIIAVFGNMIARTTTVGVLLALLYYIIMTISSNTIPKEIKSEFWKIMFIILVIGVPIVIYLYNVNSTFYSNIRFGFEGFFSLFEKGKWETTSSNILINSMVVFPDNIRTWIIGDGYAANPSVDPYYTGEIYRGYYMGTDIGYIRYIFYFGLLGLSLFIVFFLKAANICAKRFPKYELMFYMILIVNYIGWLKVTTDIFPAFAVFLAMSAKDFIQDNENLDDVC